MKDDIGSGNNNNTSGVINYQNIENHLMNFHHDSHHQHQHHHQRHHQKFDLSNKHISSNSNEKAISYNQQASRNISDTSLSLPLDLCQVNSYHTFTFVFSSYSLYTSIYFALVTIISIMIEKALI